MLAHRGEDVSRPFRAQVLLRRPTTAPPARADRPHDCGLPGDGSIDRVILENVPPNDRQPFMLKSEPSGVADERAHVVAEGNRAGKDDATRRSRRPKDRHLHGRSLVVDALHGLHGELVELWTARAAGPRHLSNSASVSVQNRDHAGRSFARLAVARTLTVVVNASSGGASPRRARAPQTP